MKRGVLACISLLFLSLISIEITLSEECAPNTTYQSYLCGKSDINQDQNVDVIDLTAIRNHYTPPVAYDVAYDIDGDGIVGDADYNITREHLGCTVPVSQCLDTDCGDDTNVRGSLLVNGRDFVIHSNGSVERLTDSCLSGVEGTLVEYYCTGGKSTGSTIYGKTNYNCSSGLCGNGRCVRQTCTDSENGRNAFVRGTAIISLDDVETTRRQDQCSNSSSNSSMVTEYYCYDSKEMRDTQILCNAGCANGACINESCSDSDSADYYVEGRVNYVENGYPHAAEDDCLEDGRRVLEYVCQGNLAVPTNFLCPNGCQNGACIRKSCSDQDGRDIYAIGIVTASLNNVSSAVADSCTNSTTLTENYCENSERRAMQVRCPSGICQNGRCVKSCSDTDGLNYYAYGEVIEVNRVFRDSCVRERTTADISNLSITDIHGDRNNNVVLAGARATDISAGSFYYNPSVSYVDGTYKMWFLDNSNSVRYATSSNGVNWNLSDNYVLRSDGNTPITCVRVLKDNGTYKMWYGAEVFGNTQPLTSNIYLRYASSPDGVNWTRNNTDILLLSAGAPAAIDISCFSVVHDQNNQTYRLWFSRGADGYSAVSDDGISWSALSKFFDNAAVSSVVYNDKIGKYEMFFERGGSIYSSINHENSVWNASVLRIPRPPDEIRNNFLFKPGIYGAYVLPAGDSYKIWYGYTPNRDSASYGSMIAYATLQKSRYAAIPSGEKLLEYSCANELTKTETIYNCPIGCSNGACLCSSDSNCAPGERCLNSSCIAVGATCPDGTRAGQCSDSNRTYCDNGVLVANCRLCNYCSPTEECRNTACVPIGGIAVNMSLPLIGRTTLTPTSGNPGTVSLINTYVFDQYSEIESVEFRVKKFQNGQYVPLSEKTYSLSDNGLNGDGLPGDHVYGDIFDTVILRNNLDYENPYKIDIIARSRNGNTAIERDKASFILTRENGNCIEAIPGFNQPDAERVNVVFVNLGSDMNTFLLKVANAIDIEGNQDGILSVEPYNSNRNKLNFWYVNQAGELNKPYCRHLGAGGEFCEDDIFSLGTECLVSNKQVIALINAGFRSNAMLQTGPSFISYSDTTRASEIKEHDRVIVHEFGGHSFGGLQDEYVEFQRYGGGSGSVNCYTSTDASTCRNSAPWSSILGAGCGNQNAIDCRESDALYNLEVSCYPGCQYSDLIFRASFNTIMRYSLGNPYSFGPYNELLIARQLDRFSGG